MDANKKLQMRLLSLVVGMVAMTMSLFAYADLAVSNACSITFDATAPSISAVGDLAARMEVGSAYTDPGATASDNVDGDVTSRIVVTGSVNTAVPGQYTITYAVSDTVGNVASVVTRVVTVSDTTAPVITLLGGVSVTVEALSSYSDAGATAKDNLDGDITSRIVTLNGVNTSKIGTYTVTYSVSDTAGNAATQVVRNVKVIDTTPPVITIKEPAS